MIRAVMLGRLGNNLFQYALGRVLSERHGVPLIMDGSWFNSEGWSQVKCLKDLPGPASGTVRIVRRCSLGARALLKATGRHYWDYSGLPTIREPEADHSFQKHYLDAPEDCMLFGYFQSPLYFHGFEDNLRNELSTSGLNLEAGNEKLADKLKQPQSVAVHVRRTDYAGNPNLDLCGANFYNNAMRKMRGLLGNPRFFIFSDDLSWCALHHTGPDIELVKHRPNTSPLADLHLMSLAGHHIIANSSYSWWAAWLGKKTGQQVFMPSQWFRFIHAPITEKQCPGWSLIDIDPSPAGGQSSSPQV